MICYFHYRHIATEMATFSGSKLHVFLTYIVRKTIAMGVAEFQRVVCAKFGGVFANLTAILTPTF